jgi:hypothetical protein
MVGNRSCLTTSQDRVALARYLRQKCWSIPSGLRRVVIAHLAALWRGDIPLGQAFWEYAIAYGTIANIVATAAAIATVAAGLPDALAICLFLTPLPYILTAVVGVVRSADKYRGAPEWATMAKIAVILWGAVMVFL